MKYDFIRDKLTKHEEAVFDFYLDDGFTAQRALDEMGYGSNIFIILRGAVDGAVEVFEETKRAFTDTINGH